MVPGAVAVPRAWSSSAPIPLPAMQDKAFDRAKTAVATAPRAAARRWSAAMGLRQVLSLGGFKGWVDAGGEAEKGRSGVD